MTTHSDILKIIAQTVAIGGLALGIFLVLFRKAIRENVFPKLKEEQAYSLLQLIIFLVWGVTIIGIGSWIFVIYTQGKSESNVTGRTKISLPMFEKEILNSLDVARLEEFIDVNRGKLVYIDTQIPNQYSRIDKMPDGRDVLSLSSIECTEEPFDLYCLTSRVIIRGKSHELSRYKGVHRFNGYFLVGENRDMHQGVNYTMESVPRPRF